MKIEDKKADWLNYFRLAVTQARDARLKGDMLLAYRLDRTVEDYYKESKEESFFDEDYLFEIETDIRNQ